MFNSHTFLEFRCVTHVNNVVVVVVVNITTTTTMVKRQWSQKTLHGHHLYYLSQQYVDIEALNKWLTNAEFFAKTEGFLTAIKVQVILTRNYKKYILKQPDTDELCRRCGKESETIQHITAACEQLAPTEYVNRHDGLAKLSIRNWQKQPN
jgi:hypothetical protein